jgi:signal peptidase I
MRTFIVCTILVFCCLAIGCKGLAYKVTTLSMSPTLNPGDAFTVNPFAYKSNPIERFDIVVFEAPDDMKKLLGVSGEMRFVMRVIGLPNEKVEIKDNKIYINDKLLDEPFEKVVDEKDKKKDFPAVKIPENEYFLLGDNRPNSNDSRHYKLITIKKEVIYSKVLEIYPGYYRK